MDDLKCRVFRVLDSRLPTVLAILSFLWLKFVCACRESSGEDSPWTREDFNALQAERNAVEAELLEHLADQDVDQLKWRAVSFKLQPFCI